MSSDFEKIYKKNYDKLYTLAFRMTGNKEESEDILQSSFLSAYKAFNNFRHDSSVYTWLYKIVLNTSKKYYKESRKLPADEYAENNNITLPEVYTHINQYGKVEDEIIANSIRENCLQMFINCMPSKYRAVYTLRVMLGFSVKETSDILEIKENTVKVNLHRARTIAKDHLNGRCSLMKPGSLCNCRSYAKFLAENNKLDALIDIQLIKNKEKSASEQYHDEMEKILEIDDLYSATIKPLDYSTFINRIKNLASTNEYKIISY